jgi:hypothetical protein
LCQNGGFSVLSSIWETEKIGWVGDDSHVATVENSLLKMKCEMVRCRDATASFSSPKFGAKSSHIFTQSPQNVKVVCGIDCLACHNEFFVNNLLDVKENYEHPLGFALHLSRLSRSR